ncbi:MAG: hypothetical protein ACPG4T_03905 [Nannocystaceae bacterium]
MTTQRQRFARHLSSAVTTRPLLTALLRLKRERVAHQPARRSAPLPVEAPLQAA